MQNTPLNQIHPGFQPRHSSTWRQWPRQLPSPLSFSHRQVGHHLSSLFCLSPRTPCSPGARPRRRRSSHPLSPVPLLAPPSPAPGAALTLLSSLRGHGGPSPSSPPRAGGGAGSRAGRGPRRSWLAGPRAGGGQAQRQAWRSWLDGPRAGDGRARRPDPARRRRLLATRRGAQSSAMARRRRAAAAMAGAAARTGAELELAVDPTHLVLELWLEEPAERGGRISSSSPATMDDSRRCSRRREREWEGEASSEPPLPSSLHRAASARASATPPREGAVGAGRVAEEQERE